MTLTGFRHDLVTWTAPCPRCGRDATWRAVRDDTRARINDHCTCAMTTTLATDGALGQEATTTRTEG